jgi:enoyl-CoA hydratase/carnithine racemase
MLEVESDGPVLRLSLARPGARNALDEELIRLLLDQFKKLSGEVRVVVLTGEGSAFCAGGDLEWMRRGAQATPQANYEDALQLAALLEAIATCPAAVVARVNGHCFGGGCGLVAAADLAVGAEGALFAFSEVRLGLVPATICPYVIDRIGRGHARALFVTGETFDASIAHKIGLLHEVCPLERLDSVVEDKLVWLLKAGPNAVASVKAMVHQREFSKEEAARLLATVRSREEAQEGIAAFFERRSPSYLVELIEPSE